MGVGALAGVFLGVGALAGVFLGVGALAGVFLGVGGFFAGVGVLTFGVGSFGGAEAMKMKIDTKLEMTMIIKQKIYNTYSSATPSLLIR